MWTTTSSLLVYSRSSFHVYSLSGSTSNLSFSLGIYIWHHGRSSFLPWIGSNTHPQPPILSLSNLTFFPRLTWRYASPALPQFQLVFNWMGIFDPTSYRMVVSNTWHSPDPTNHLMWIRSFNIFISHEERLIAVKRILRFLKGTLTHGLTIPPISKRFPFLMLIGLETQMIVASQLDPGLLS